MSTFSLLRLPQKTLKNVILQMGHIELICTSLLSNKTKHFIREFCIFKASRFSIELNQSVQFKMFNNGRWSEYSFKNGMICITSFGIIQITMTFRTPQFNAGSWFNHFLCVLSPSKIESVTVTDAFDELRFQLVKKFLEKIQFMVLWIRTTSATSHMVRLFSEVLPVDQFWLSQDDRLNSSQFSALRPVLSKELETIFIDNRMPLNDLLITCSTAIHIIKSPLTDKEINVFLKHWMTGLKPELEHIYIEKSGVFNQTQLLDGINHDAPTDRKFKMYGNDAFRGIDLHLGQGIKATLVYENDFFHSKIHIASHNSKYISFE
ncbi:F-box domain-containing protein [Caenorhabditis elegans]|uniref:F-box domain-containing protein n=1 Tax=Caenorhabditis elegans TaxID=6239 RepID=Q9N3J6_CAEEL|nr:F-box domain-containing protein [Caenorhabditis elegans]CCD72685.1 F-box domain-containing protein [Caenorhabditis elegans]|eukprot:NP_493990.1 F-box B protein [Caenorhabditis elegans]